MSLIIASRIIGKEAPDRAQWVVKKTDVLVSTVRPIRNAVVLVTEELKNLVCSSGFCVLQSKDISSEYLFLYFKTNFVAYLLDRYTTATEYPAVSWSDLLNIPIYLGKTSFRKNITSFVHNAFKLLKQSKVLYSQAQTMLLEVLALKGFDPNYELFYTANLSEAFGALRVDAEYFQPAYEKIIERTLKRFPILLLKNIFDFRRGVFIPTEYYTEQKTKTPYVRIKELSGTIGIDTSKVTFINNDYPEDKINELREDDLVLTIIGDTIGKTNKIPKCLVGGFCSNNMGRLRIRPEWRSKILPEFAEILFQSFFIQSQIEKKKAPTGQPKINDNEIKTIKIPILPNDIQKKIASLVQQSHEARQKAKELLEESKRKVEQAIEKELK